MPFEFIQQKQLVLTELMQALETIQQAVPHLSPGERIEVLKGLTELFTEAPGADEATPVTDAQPEPREPRSSSPARSVKQLVSNSPVPLYASDIVMKLEDEIETTSKSPKDVIYSAIAYLKREGELVQLPTKGYVTKQQYDEQYGPAGAFYTPASR